MVQGLTSPGNVKYDIDSRKHGTNNIRFQGNDFSRTLDDTFVKVTQRISTIVWTFELLYCVAGYRSSCWLDTDRGLPFPILHNRNDSNVQTTIMTLLVGNARRLLE